MEYAIETRNLTKYFYSGKEKIVAVDKVNLKIRKGEFFGLLGPNGAGKTTLTKIIATLLIPDEGEAWVEGYSILKEPIEVRKRIGWMMGETGGRALYWRLSGRDNLMFFAKLMNVPKKIAEKRINVFLRFLELDKAADKLVLEYSTGMRVKLMLIRSLLHNPDVLLLDEPTLGLDVESATKVRSFLRRLVDELGKTILFTSHNMYEVEALCDRIAIINKGKIIYDGSPRKIRELFEEVKVVEINLREEKVSLEEIKQSIEKVDTVEKIVAVNDSKGYITLRAVVTDPYQAVTDIATKLKGYRVEGIQRVLPTLEEAFLKIAKGKKIKTN